MNPATRFKPRVERQGRKLESRAISTACRYHRSLSSDPRQSRFALLPLLAKCLLIFVVSIIFVLASSVVAGAQEVAETIRIRTRVVFMDALVKDKRTGTPISDLTQENFEVFDEGKLRPISYFTREGQARKPLALVLILDLREDGAGRFLRRSEILEAMAAELAKLSPGDEVAILAMNINSLATSMNSAQDSGAVIGDRKAVWLTEFTNDRQQVAAALSRAPSLIEFLTDNGMPDTEVNEKPGQEDVKTTSAPVEKKPGEEASREAATQTVTAPEIAETETIRGKNGAVVTRTVKKDGSVSVTRVSGKKNVALDDIYDLPQAVRDAGRLAREQRPNSQASIVWVSDGIVPVFFEDRDATEQLLIRDNIIFNSLTVDLRRLFKFLLPFAKPVGNWIGMSIYGSAKRMAQQTGGEAVRVNRVKDYGAGLSRIIGNLTARYSLGFTIEESEEEDGRLHALELRVKAQDAKGKTRKLEVSARKGYYMVNAAEKQSAATRAQ